MREIRIWGRSRDGGPIYDSDDGFGDMTTESCPIEDTVHIESECDVGRIRVHTLVPL